MPIFLQIGANSHTCGFHATTFVGFMNSLGVTLTVCHNLGFLRFSLSKIGCTNFRSPLVKFFSFVKFEVFSVSKVISCCLMALVTDLKCRQQFKKVGYTFIFSFFVEISFPLQIEQVAYYIVQN